MLFATLKGEKIIFTHRLRWCGMVHAHTCTLAVVLPGTGDVYVIHKSALPRECWWKLHCPMAAWQQICLMVYFYLVCWAFLTSFFGYYCKWQFWDAIFSCFQDLQGLDIYVGEDIHPNKSSIKNTWKPSCFRASLFNWSTHGPDPQWVCFVWTLLWPQMWVSHYSKQVPASSESSSRACQPGSAGSAPNISCPQVWLYSKTQQGCSREPNFKVQDKPTFLAIHKGSPGVR